MTKRKLTSVFKSKVVLEALSERCSLTELASKYQLSPSQISIWKKEFLTNASRLFEKGDSKKVESMQSDRDELLRTIGEQKVEIDFLKKSLKRLG
jgi:transposase